MSQPDRLDVLETERRLLGAIMTSDAAYRDLLTFRDEIGPRFAGSPVEREAARFMKRRMESDGLDSGHLERVACSPSGSRIGKPAFTSRKAGKRR